MFMSAPHSASKSEFLSYVQKYVLVPETKCYRHCEETAKFVTIQETESSFVGGYVCPGNYVSRVMYFADRPDPEWFESFLRDQIGKDRLRSRDVRMATRHGWELGLDAEAEIMKAAPGTGSVKQFYWVFYPQNDEEKKYGTFLCPTSAGGCGSLFTKSLTDESVLCPACSAKK